jgi:predicted membrane channel-forming protein YqfA (hemolysin III family)
VGVVFTCGKNIVTTMLSGIFVLVAAVCHYVAILLAVVSD